MWLEKAAWSGSFKLYGRLPGMWVPRGSPPPPGLWSPTWNMGPLSEFTPPPDIRLIYACSHTPAHTCSTYDKVLTSTAAACYSSLPWLSKIKPQTVNHVHLRIHLLIPFLLTMLTILPIYLGGKHLQMQMLGDAEHDMKRKWQLLF